MTVVEKAAFLKGLIAGQGMNPESKEGKLWGTLTDLLSDMAHQIQELQEADMDFADALDEIAEDLSYLEELTCDLDRPEDMEDGDRCPACCSGCGPQDEDEDEAPVVAAADYDGVIYDVTCPSCGEEVSFDEETLEEGSINCPYCGELLEFDLDPENEEE